MNLPKTREVLIDTDESVATKRVGYRTLRGFIKILKQQNKQAKKLGVEAAYTIILPIRY